MLTLESIIITKWLLMGDPEKTEKLIIELHDRIANQREKFIYYMIAIAVTSIGFSVLRTQDASFKLIHIPLALAILSWLLSIHYGFTNIVKTLAVLRSNVAYLYIKQGINPLDGTIMPDIDNPTEIVEKSIKKNNERTGIYFNRQKRLLYGGILLFICWHLLEMYFRN
jgi:hypothetical protein